MCFAARVSTDGVPGAEGSMEKIDLEIQHTTPPICGNLVDLYASVKVLVHVTNVQVMFTPSMQLPGLGWWPHPLTPNGP